MEKWILEIMNNYGYLGMALLILAENLFPPIPSEVIQRNLPKAMPAIPAGTEIRLRTIGIKRQRNTV